MSAEEFFRLLARTPRDWRRESGKIRRGPLDDPDCPITAVARLLVGAMVPGAGGVNRAAHGLDLEGQLASQIVAASDDLAFADRRIRRNLLEACGLTPDETEAAAVGVGHGLGSG